MLKKIISNLLVMLVIVFNIQPAARFEKNLDVFTVIKNAKEISEIEEAFKSGVDVNQQDENGNTPLILAAQLKSIDLFGLLLNMKADITIRNKENKIFLDYLLSRESKIEFMREYSAQKNNEWATLKEPEEKANFIKKQSEIVIKLFQANANIKERNNQVKRFLELLSSPIQMIYINQFKIHRNFIYASLINAIDTDNVKLLSDFLETNTDYMTYVPNKPKDQTLLMHACDVGKVKIAELLLKLGFDEIKDTEKEVALAIAKEKGNKDIIKLLEENKESQKKVSPNKKRKIVESDEKAIKLKSEETEKEKKLKLENEVRRSKRLNLTYPDKKSEESLIKSESEESKIEVKIEVKEEGKEEAKEEQDIVTTEKKVKKRNKKTAPKISCQYCDALIDPTNRRRHEGHHKYHPEKKSICRIGTCSKACSYFSSDSLLSRHQSQAHSFECQKEDPYCKICGVLIDRNRERHAETHRKKDKKYSCEIGSCKPKKAHTYFPTKLGLARHQAKTHKDEETQEVEKKSLPKKLSEKKSQKEKSEKKVKVVKAKSMSKKSRSKSSKK